VELKPLKHEFLLYGSYELTIDDKNRLQIPSEMRRSLDPDRDGEELFILVGANRKIWFYPDRYYRELVSQKAPEIVPENESLEFDHLNFANAFREKWDKQGRISMRDRLLKRTETGRNVTMIGARDHMECWNTAEWNAWSEELDRRRAEIAQGARQIRQTS
jgi:division/cell wall cluster transcriptional repressor MraZ